MGKNWVRSSPRVGIFVVVVLVATAGLVYLAQSRRTEGVIMGTTQVVVSTQDILANKALDPYIDEGVFTTVGLPNSALVAGAVTNIAELRGQRTAATIYANEQIPTSRLANPSCQPPDVTHIVFQGGAYIRDVDHRLPGGGRYDGTSPLPRNAVQIGLSVAGGSVLVVPHVDVGPVPSIYVRYADHVERWPLYTGVCQ